MSKFNEILYVLCKKYRELKTKRTEEKTKDHHLSTFWWKLIIYIYIINKKQNHVGFPQEHIYSEFVTCVTKTDA